MPSPKSILAAKQLITEGSDAEKFFTALLRETALSGIQVQNFGGKDELQGFLKALRNAPDFARVVSLGIVRDAEEDPKAAFQSVCSALQNAGLAVPKQPMMPEGHRPQVTVLILPDAARPGMLETVCLDTVADDQAAQCVDEYFECLAQKANPMPKNMYKARLHAFLASRQRPGLRLGEAAEAGYWPWKSPALDLIRQFMGQL